MRLSIDFCTTLNAHSCTETHSDDTTLYVWETRSVPQCSLEHPCSCSFSVSHSSHNSQNNSFSATHLFRLYCTYLHIMMRFDHDKFLPPVVKLSTTPYCTYISSSQYNGTHYNNSTQYGNQYTSTDCTSLPLHGNSPSICPSNVSAHNDRQIDSAHFVVSMPYDLHTSPSLVSICNDRPTDSFHIVPYVDTLVSRQCNTEHTSTGGVARNGNVLVANSNPVSTHASTGSVNPYLNK
jgi:hypothetical protein